MPAVVPDEGALVLLAEQLGLAPSLFPLTVRLFTNDHDPARGDTLATYTEATFPGYYRPTINAGDFTPPSMVAGRARSKYLPDPMAWNVGASGQTVHGYYVVSAGLKVIQAERFDNPRDLEPGSRFEATLYAAGRSEFPV